MTSAKRSHLPGENDQHVTLVPGPCGMRVPERIFMKRRTPSEIETLSLQIIEREAGRHVFSPGQWQVVRRIIHATADFDILKTIRFHPRAIAAAVAALQNGRPIYTDTAMLAAGISDKARSVWGCSVICRVGDPDVWTESQRTGLTRSELAVRAAARDINGGIVAIGNAPTALHEALSLCEQGLLDPAAVIGMPVGFVEARESKERLFASAQRYITNIDRKGGTPAAAAAVNALVKLAEAT